MNAPDAFAGERRKRSLTQGATRLARNADAIGPKRVQVIANGTFIGRQLGDLEAVGCCGRDALARIGRVGVQALLAPPACAGAVDAVRTLQTAVLARHALALGVQGEPFSTHIAPGRTVAHPAVV